MEALDSKTVTFVAAYGHRRVASWTDRARNPIVTHEALERFAQKNADFISNRLAGWDILWTVGSLEPNIVHMSVTKNDMWVGERATG